MQMTLEEARKRFPHGPEPIALQYAGQWVAWNKDRKSIVAHGANFGKFAPKLSLPVVRSR